MKRALGLALAAMMVLPVGMVAQSDVPAPWNADETITVNNSAVPGVLVMHDEDFCRSMALLLSLYQGDASPSDEQIAKCAEVIAGQMVTQAWMPQTWNRIVAPTRTPASPAKVTGRAMTMEEAGEFYQRNVRRANLVVSQWNCARRKAKNGLSWKQMQHWSKKYAAASKRFDRQLRSVEWPKSVQRKVDRLLDADAAEEYRRKNAYNYKSLLASVTSGAYAKYTKANDKSGEAAAKVRAALGIATLPQGGNACKQVKRLQRLIREG